MKEKKSKDSKEKSDFKRYQTRPELKKKGGIYYYSSSIAGHKNVFVTPEYLNAMVNAFKRVEIQQDVKNIGYVIMPNFFCWIFQLSPKEDDPMPVYREVKKQVSYEILNNLKMESKMNEHFPMLELFQNNEKVSRSTARKILWQFKEAAKKYENKKYRVWEQKSFVCLLKDDKGISEYLEKMQGMPVSERWDLVGTAQDYPYLYLAESVAV